MYISGHIGRAIPTCRTGIQSPNPCVGSPGPERQLAQNPRNSGSPILARALRLTWIMTANRLPTTLGCALALALAGGCGGDSGGDDDSTVGASYYMVTGTVLDFSSGQPLDVATVSTDGLVPAPTISVTGAAFTIENIPQHSVFHVLAGAPPNYRSTYNAPVSVTTADLDGVDVFAVGEDFLAGLASAFGIAGPTGSVLLAQVVDEGGAPLAGIPGTAFELPDAIVGPYFLDADRQPDANLSATSASGWVAFFSVPPGLVSISATLDSGYTMTMADSPAANTAVTLASIQVIDGQVALPTNVSFSNDVAPIFLERGCVGCHDGGGIGKDLGDLHLNGADEKMYRELAEEISPTHNTARVNIQAPELSLMLTMPAREDPPDAHPNVTFASKTDPDYLIILGWITEGALKN